MSSKKSTKTAQFTKEKDESIRKVASELTAESALASIAEVQASLGKTLASVGEKLQAKLQELANVNRAVELEKEELSRIHDVGIIAQSIEEAQAVFEARKAELGKLSAAALLDYDEKVAEARRKYDLERDEIEQHRKRDVEQYSYDLGQEQKKRRESFDEEIRLLRNAERDRSEVLAKDWAVREGILGKAESEIVELRIKVNEFPAVLKGEVDKQVGIVGNTVKRDYEHRISLLQKDAEAEKKVADMTNRSLQEQVSKLSTELASAYARLTAADEKVAKIAEKALESASGQRALSEIQSFTQRENGATSRKT